MLIYKYERVSFSSVSYIAGDLGHNRNGENYRQIIERMANEGYSYKGFMPIHWENGKPTDVDLIFEHPGVTKYR